MPTSQQIPDAFREAFEAYTTGLVGLESVCEILRTTVHDDPEGTADLRNFLHASLSRGLIAEPACEVLIAELARLTTEAEVHTDLSGEYRHTGDTVTGPTGGESAAGTQPAADKTIGPAPGTILRKRFALDDYLGGGAMGRIFRARDRLHVTDDAADAWLAVKVVGSPAGAPSRAADALHREASTTRRLSHPNIIRVFDVDCDGDHTFMTMEWLDGESLAKILDSRQHRPMPRVQALQIIEGVCRGLAHAHALGIAHADVKPANVLITRDGHVKLMDFGVAHEFGTDEAPRGHTPEYASCEVLEGAAPTAQDDLFSVACVAYRMLAGRRAFGTRTALEARAAGTRPARIEALSPAQWRALDQALAFSRDGRQADVNTFLAQLKGPREEFAARPQSPAADTSPQPAAVPERAGPLPANRRTPVLIGAGVAAAAIVAVILLQPAADTGTASHPVSPSPVSAATPPAPRSVVDSASGTLPVAEELLSTAHPDSADAGGTGAQPAGAWPAGTAEAVAGQPVELAAEPVAELAGRQAPAAMLQASEAGTARPSPATGLPLPPVPSPASGPPAIQGPPLPDPSPAEEERSVPPASDTDTDWPYPPLPPTFAAANPSTIATAGRVGAAADTATPAADPVENGRGRALDAGIREVAFGNLRLRRYVEPEYPRLEAAAGTAGWVDVTFIVERNGRTRDVEVVAAEPAGNFDAAAVTAVRRWRFADVDDMDGIRSRVRVRFQPAE